MLTSPRLVVGVGQTLLMTSLAEYCSIWPTAGGQQYFVQAVAPAKLRPILSYLVGWAVIVAEISVGSSCALNSAQLIAAFVEVTHPDIVWHAWMTWLLYSVVLVGPVLLNLRHSWLPAINLFAACFTIGAGITWAVVFGAMAEHKHTAEFVFTKFLNNSGYSNSGWVFIMSLYTPMYALYGTDGLMHLVEEVKDASRVAPRAIVWSMIFCCVTTWLTALLMMWTAGNFESYVDADQPYLNWFMDVTRSVYGGGVFCCLIMCFVNFFVIVGTNSAGSRLVWSMARDKAFPYSDYFATINPRFGIPFRSMVAILVVEAIIGTLT